MKAKLEFNLPEEENEFRHAIHGTIYFVILHELDDWLRNEYKYKENESLLVVTIRNKITELCDDRNINIWE